MSKLYEENEWYRIGYDRGRADAELKMLNWIYKLTQQDHETDDMDLVEFIESREGKSAQD